ncbi:MAG: hypothetical protein WCK51_09680 [Armatimonadota bacterium]
MAAINFLVAAITAAIILFAKGLPTAWWLVIVFVALGCIRLWESRGGGFRRDE